jgi:23S rRNA (guanosine2251-2'-O)-methyltransferase
MSDNAWHEGDAYLPSSFYQCLDRAACGLRFPVNQGDAFARRCPRCGGDVREVAAPPADHAGAGVPSTSPAHAAPTSQIHLLLDNWRSLFNVGAAFRTADGAGLRHLYLCGITATPNAQPKLAKTALGAECAVAWSYHADAVTLAQALKQQGMTLWVLEHGIHSGSLFGINADSLTVPLVLVAGNEKAGVDPGLVEMADRVIHLPMAGMKASLNVAVAASVATYWLRAQEIATVNRHPLR